MDAFGVTFMIVAMNSIATFVRWAGSREGSAQAVSRLQSCRASCTMSGSAGSTSATVACSRVVALRTVFSNAGLLGGVGRVGSMIVLTGIVGVGAGFDAWLEHWMASCCCGCCC